MKRILDGTILRSQACFIANGPVLLDEEVFRVARQLLEFFEATLRAERYVNVFANIRGEPETVLKDNAMLAGITGLQGPTVSTIFREDPWFAMHVVVEKAELPMVIRAIRELGGSGVIVTQPQYIFEEEPLQCKLMIQEVQRRKGL